MAYLPVPYHAYVHLQAYICMIGHQRHAVKRARRPKGRGARGLGKDETVGAGGRLRPRMATALGAGQRLALSGLALSRHQHQTSGGAAPPSAWWGGPAALRRCVARREPYLAAVQVPSSPANGPAMVPRRSPPSTVVPETNIGVPARTMMAMF